ncbi:MAG: SpoIIE family protein phosphatase [Papillibacter sp.]|nr:SpoIIE family protein phosphatase [Papillibacter sp.]
MNDLYIDIGYGCINKDGEQLCGDQVVVERQSEGSAVVVLADGMGSGVKANILATLTSKILTTMLANSIDLNECVSTVAATLPICKIRKAAYSTFTAVRITYNTEAELIQYDNPDVIYISNGKNIDYPKSALLIDEKTVYISKRRLSENDLIVIISDGVIHTGTDGVVDESWDRDSVAGFITEHNSLSISSKALATLLLNECRARYKGNIMDDTSVCVIKIKKRRQVNLVIGPPADKKDDEKMMSLFFSKAGKTIVSGGTTAEIAARFLGKELITTLDYEDEDVPPVSKIEGVDLVTEGVLTMNRVLQYAKDFLEDNSLYSHWSRSNDAASQIARLLFDEATDINFFVGEAVNPAHQNPSLPLVFRNKMRLIMELSDCLKKMGKQIKVSYF